SQRCSPTTVATGVSCRGCATRVKASAAATAAVVAARCIGASAACTTRDNRDAQATAKPTAVAGAVGVSSHTAAAAARDTRIAAGTTKGLVVDERDVFECKRTQVEDGAAGAQAPATGRWKCCGGGTDATVAPTGYEVLQRQVVECQCARRHGR